MILEDACRYIFAKDWNRMEPANMKRIMYIAVSVMVGGVLPILADAGAEGGMKITARAPVVPMKDPPKPIKYFQHMWGSSVYPIGNGRLGATVYGDMAAERIQFNTDSLWSGDENDTGAYQNTGELAITFEGHDGADATNSGYLRTLDIEKALHTITYEAGGVRYRREYFASHPAGVEVFRFTADRSGSYSGTVRLIDAHNGETNAAGSVITISGRVKPGTINLAYEAQAMVLNDGGSLSAKDGTISFQGCDSLTIMLDADTDYLNVREKGWKREHPHARIVERLEKASKKGYGELLEEHISDYESLFNRVVLDLGAAPAETLALNTEQRLAAYREGKPDPDIEEMLFQYARYLMISSSRPGDLPATLQGVWNPYNWPPWRSDYHTDVNVEMNYWFVDQANLSECFLPLAEWVNSIREVRREATFKEFGVRGWATRSENGIFGGATYHWVPGDASWVAQNLWDHYAFTQDREYLRDRAYPVMKELCEYWEDSMKERPDGKLVSPVGQSPEHGPFTQGNSYDQQLAWDVFSNYIEGSLALDADKEYREKVAGMRSRLLGPQIGKWGQLQEWAEDLDDPKDQHRHLSHLIAVHPSRQISPSATPELAEAARVSMNARGDGATGWSKAWKICIWARLQDGNRAYKLCSEFIKGNVYPNLWGFHPPFQIDCNFGYAAGVCEMLLQSHMQREGKSYIVELLPALPDAWAGGSVKGLRARGGYEVDLAWKDGKLERAVVRNISSPGGACVVKYGKAEVDVDVAKGSAREFGPRDFAP